MTISEVAKKYEMTPEGLRYYERIGLLPPVNRNKNGLRDYTEEDCGWIEFIKCMRGAGLPIEVLIEYVQLFKDESTLEARRAILEEQYEKLLTKIAEMQTVANKLKGKLKYYDDKIENRDKTNKCKMYIRNT